MQNVKNPHKLEILKHIFTTCIGSLGFVFSWKWNFGIGLLQVDDQDGEEAKHDENRDQEDVGVERVVGNRVDEQAKERHSGCDGQRTHPLPQKQNPNRSQG